MRINAKSIAVSGLVAGCAAAGGASPGAAAAATASSGNGAPVGAAGVTYVPAVIPDAPTPPNRCTDTANTDAAGDLPNISACSTGVSFLVNALQGTSWKGYLWSTAGNKWTDYGHGWREVGAIGVVGLESNVLKTTIGHAQAFSGGGIHATEAMKN